MAQYSFRAKMWKYRGPAGWHFVTLPKRLAATIRREHGAGEEGWGRLKTSARIGQSTWATAVWFDSKAQSYLLPVKATVRKSEGLEVDASVTVRLEFRRARSAWKA